MPVLAPYEYSIVRLVPCIEREEFINFGVLLFCKQHRFLGARIELDEPRLLLLAPRADVCEIRRHLDLIQRIVAGDRDAGEIGALSQAERFRWLTSPRNTVVQPSPVHPGLSLDPQASLDALFERLVTATVRD